MFDQQCWVIRNEDGYFVNAKFGALFTGITTGFVVDENEEKYCLEISDGAVGWFPKENFKVL